jgi:hypothetical protein
LVFLTFALPFGGISYVITAHLPLPPPQSAVAIVGVYPIAEQQQSKAYENNLENGSEGQLDLTRFGGQFLTSLSVL